MPERTHRGSAATPFGRGPREDHPAEAPVGDPGAAPSGHPGDVGAVAGIGEAAGTATPLDPELLEDLAAELPLRGDQLAEAFEAMQAEAAEWREKGMRAQAEYENTRKRLELRHADALLRAGERVVEALFPVMDDLERAIDHAVGENAEVAEGLGAVHRKLAEVIAREGCTAIDPLGAAFDPERHNAVQMSADDSVPDHTVVEVFQKGYEMHGRVLRPAMVVVASGGPAANE